MGNLVQLLITLALFGFLWGVLQYFRQASSPEGRSSSIKYMSYGLFSLFVITSVWGFVYLLGGTLGIDLGDGPQDVPEVNLRESFDQRRESNFPEIPEDANFDLTEDFKERNVGGNPLLEIIGGQGVDTSSDTSTNNNISNSRSRSSSPRYEPSFDELDNY